MKDKKGENMKKNILSAFVLGVFILCGALALAETSPATTTVTITNSSLDYSWTPPPKTASFTMKSRTAADFKISSASGVAAGGTNYVTVPSGSSYYENAIWATGNSPIYLSSANAGQIIEIVYWQSN